MKIAHEKPKKLYFKLKKTVKIKKILNEFEEASDKNCKRDKIKGNKVSRIPWSCKKQIHNSRLIKMIKLVKMLQIYS